MVPRRPLIWILAACLALASCRSFDSASPTPEPVGATLPAPAPSPIPKTPTPAPEYVAKLRNADYQLGLSDSLQAVKLTDGRFEQGAPGGTDYISVVMTDFIVRGSFDGSGDEEYAALVSENYGGTGSFMFLVVYVDVNGMPRFITSRIVDDRPLINELSAPAANEIFLDAVIHSAQDPMCCPTLRTTRHYRVDGLGSLIMTDYTTFTPAEEPRTINIQSPANHAEVFSSVQIRGEVAIAPFENNLVYRIFDIGGVELAVGSITVTASEPGGPGTFDQTISLGNILSGAAIRIEVQDVNAEDGSLFAMDSVDLVVK